MEETPYEEYVRLWEEQHPTEEDQRANPLLPYDNKWWPLDHMVLREFVKAS